MSTFNHGWWHSADGLRLHYRDYPGAGNAERASVLCLPGLTRNARDFEGLAGWLSSPEGGGWRVICAEMRGRGLSAYADDPMTYTPAQYVGDVLALLDQAGLDRVVAVGTSLGGLMTLALAMMVPDRLAGAVLNDIGPVIEPEGLAKIGRYLGTDPRFADWEAASAALRVNFATTYPEWGQAEWLAMARRVMVEEGTGEQRCIRFDYDPRIAAPFQAGASAPMVDLWPGLEALGRRPLLLVRGGLSDILSAETLAEMQRRAPGAAAITLPHVGHAPTLDEPEAVAAITGLLDGLR